MGLFRRKRDNEPVDPEDRSPNTGLKYKDLAILDQLMKAGAQLRQPRHARYFLYFQSRAEADAAAHDARQRAFEVDVSEPMPQHPGQWSVVCERHGIVLDIDTVRDNTDYFESIAQQHGGEFDGWEASLR